LPDLMIGLPTARDQQRAVDMLKLQQGQTVLDASCGSGFNLGRLVRAVGPAGTVTAIENNAHLLRQARRKVERAGWRNVRFLPAISAEVGQVDGVIVSYDPPIILQREDLIDGAWSVLMPGGRLTLVAGRCTTRSGRLLGPLVRAGIVLLGHGENWKYWTVHEPWQHLAQLADGNVRVWPRLGFQYLLCAEKAGSGSSTLP
jgi:SAM-dependent methyltransferase